MKRLTATISSFAIYLFGAPLAFASDGADHLNICPPDAQFGFVCDINNSNFGQIIGTVIIVFFILAIVIALIWLVIGGIKWITSSGDKTAVDAARGQIIAAVIGLIIVFLSFFILNIVLGIFGIELTNLTIPTLNLNNPDPGTGN